MSEQADLDPEILREFLLESYENLDQLDRDLVELEAHPESHELLAGIFRTIHTIKGTSGFLALNRLESLTHVGENLLARLRDGAAALTPETATVLLRMVDLVRDLLNSIERTGADTGIDVTAMVAEIRAVTEGEAPAADIAAAVPEPDAAVPEPTPARAAERTEPAEPAALPEAPELAKEPAEPIDARATISDSSIRVDVELLEHLVRLAGELVLARNQIVRRATELGDEHLDRACHRLNLVAGELQEGVMRTRMQPIDHIWAKLPRVVRDLGTQLGRSVRLEMEGGDTELDRTLLEAIKDPLTHLVRNAIDHGIEQPAERLAAGKPESGVLRLRAAHEGGQILVEVVDDGKGIDPEVVAAKAVAKQLITAAEREHLGVADILRLVFVPGFSTAAAVTNVSGRGVGMDVVRTNLERIGGTIDVDSTPGVGTTWRLRIPLTLAIVPALTVLCGGERYAIPQVNLLELVSLGGEDDPRLERIGNAQVYRLRGSLLPLVNLADALGVPSDVRDGRLVIAVLESDGRRFGLVVDRVLDTEEIVVKPLSGVLKEVGLYAGATILGDGRVSLILDVQSLARRGVRPGEGADAVLERRTGDTADSHSDRQLLVVAIGDDRQLAIPLDFVTRLEKFPPAAIERVGHREVVRYRDEVLPLVRLGAYLGSGELSEGAELPAVVYSARGRSVALLVREIVDIVAESAAIANDIDDTGLLGSTVLRDRVTELLDVRAAILAADPLFFLTGADPARLDESTGALA